MGLAVRLQPHSVFQQSSSTQALFHGVTLAHTASTAPRLGTTIALGSGGISEVAGQYPHLEHTTRDGLSSLEWLAPVQEPAEPSQSTGMYFSVTHTWYTCTQSMPHHWRLHMHQYSGHGWFGVSSLA